MPLASNEAHRQPNVKVSMSWAFLVVDRHLVYHGADGQTHRPDQAHHLIRTNPLKNRSRPLYFAPGTNKLDFGSVPRYVGWGRWEDEKERE